MPETGGSQRLAGEFLACSPLARIHRPAFARILHLVVSERLIVQIVLLAAPYFRAFQVNTGEALGATIIAWVA